jgi:hypothetical protein
MKQIPTERRDNVASRSTTATTKCRRANERRRASHNATAKGKGRQTSWAVEAQAKRYAEGTAWSICSRRHPWCRSDGWSLARQGHPCEHWAGDSLRPWGGSTHGRSLVTDRFPPKSSGSDLAHADVNAVIHIGGKEHRRHDPPIMSATRSSPIRPAGIRFGRDYSVAIKLRMQRLSPRFTVARVHSTIMHGKGALPFAPTKANRRRKNVI